MTKNVKKYLSLKKKYEKEEDDIIQSQLEEQMDELYYELSESEITEIEESEIERD